MEAWYSFFTFSTLNLFKFIYCLTNDDYADLVYSKLLTLHVFLAIKATYTRAVEYDNGKILSTMITLSLTC